MTTHKLARFGWSVLGWNLAVILWGAYVRATGSGAGCGAHWPLCNGEIVPRAPSIQMLVEFSHRVTSGLALLAVSALFVLCRRGLASPHPARRAAAWSMFFMLTEAAVGAALVLFQLVADNASMARALFMSVHLMNTFALLACLTLTAWWLSGGAPIRVAGTAGAGAAVAAGVAALFAAGVSGAIAALGDTLYPADTLSAALATDLSATSHVLIRLRVLHPVIAVAVALGLITASARGLPEAARVRRLLVALVLAQVASGIANVLLLAPVWMQMVHLLLADFVWLTFVVFCAVILAARRPLADPVAS